MIRINLLAADKPEATKKKTASAPGNVQAYLILGLFAGGMLLACLGLWWMKTTSIQELDEKIASAKKRQAELQAIKVQVEQFLQRKRILDAKVKLIEQLKAQQSGPVHMLDEISKSLPDFVWLTSMDQAGNKITFAGESNGLTAVADFISNLQRSGWFPKVDLVSTQEANNVIQFQLTADFQPQAPPAAAPAAGTPAPAPPAAAAKP
jgi:type IV pilus assembly protein PilN